MIRVPGNSPPKIDAESQVPTTGMDSMIAEAMRRPVPERPSSVADLAAARIDSLPDLVRRSE